MDAGTGSQGRCKGDERMISVSDSPLNVMFRVQNIAVSHYQKCTVLTCRFTHVHRSNPKNNFINLDIYKEIVHTRNRTYVEIKVTNFILIKNMGKLI